ncbi:60S acidic ribosomal protein P0 [Glycine soja]|uniref:60S acidic ribosomal protein P0 n=1 Tax=Glycine soja TaxID=3848 RepID=A0A445J0K2_GLYSO|nr:60S acidic ribosomal protein P0 [Glycine soja]
MTSLRSLMVVVTSLSLAISYPTLAATPHMFVNAYKNVLGVVVETDYSFLEADKDPSKFVVIVVAALVVESGAHVAAKEEEKKEEAAKEPDDGIAHPLGIWFRFCKNIWVNKCNSWIMSKACLTEFYKSANAGFYASRYKRFGNLWYINGALQAFIRHQNQDLRISLGAPITTNPSTSSIHISTSKSMIHVVAPTPNTLPTAQDQPNPNFVRESIPTTPIRDASPSTLDDYFTPEYPPDPNCEHIVDQRPFIRAYKGEFQPTYGYSNIISNIIRTKFDEPAASWLKVSVDLRDRWFGEFKRIGGTYKKSEPLEPFLRQKEKYQHRQDEILQHSTKEGTSTRDSPNTATFVNDNEIYLNADGGPNYKGNVYELGTLSKRFSCSKSAPSTSIAPVEDQIEKMRETINKLNVELLAKANKEKILEEKML